MSWNGKVIVVTGGSAGLGLEIAKAFDRDGAAVWILGRNETRLESALNQLSDKANSLAVDMADEQQVEQAVADVVRRSGQLDAWVNNVGASSRGAAIDTSIGQYQEALDANFFTAVRGSQAAAPHLKETGGSLVFIGSLASKTASPHLGAYPVAKFAVAAYAHQLRLELASDGVHVLLVCPGPIKREDSGSRYDHQTADLPDSAKQPGGGAKVKALDPAKLASQIVSACNQRRAELVVPAKAKWLFAVSQVSPSFGDWILRRSTDSS